jgi:hypothetical protein
MIARAIENWLTRADERGFQLPYCQLLCRQGYRTLHVSTHGPFEQGKDIIAVDSSGRPCGFQLKAGDIDLNRWRDEVWPEVEELLNIPIRHPSVSGSSPHRSILVVTGAFTDPVRVQIDDRNRDRVAKGFEPLETIVKGQLLTDFVAAAEEVLPREAEDLHRLLDLYIRDGRDPFPKKDFAALLASLGPLAQKSPAATARFAASVAIIAAYLVAPYERRLNWWAAADGWICTMIHLLALAEANGATAELGTSIELSMLAVDRALEELAKEAYASPDLLQPGSFFDGFFVTLRATILAGYLSAWRLVRLLQGASDWRTAEHGAFLARSAADHELFSEGAVPLRLAVFWYLHHSDQRAEARALLGTLLGTLTACQRSDAAALLKPYYEHETVARLRLEILEEPIYETFRGSSFALASLVQLAARHELRAELEKIWRPLSHLHLTEFHPAESWQHFLYRSPKGRETSILLNETQSWKELMAEANAVDHASVPLVLQAHPECLPYLLVAFPHRLTQQLTKFLDERLAEADPAAAASSAP